MGHSVRRPTLACANGRVLWSRSASAPGGHGAERCATLPVAAGPSEPVASTLGETVAGATRGALVAEVSDLTRRGIIDALKLKRPIYGQTATYGHFGRRPFTGVYQDDGRSQKVDFFTWERTDRVKDLLSAAR